MTLTDTFPTTSKALSLLEDSFIENEVLQQAIIAGITRLKARKEKTITLTQSQLFELTHKL